MSVYPPAWRQRVEAEVAEHERRGKTCSRKPTSEVEWRALYERFPRAIYAAWFAITGRVPGIQ